MVTLSTAMRCLDEEGARARVRMRDGGSGNACLEDEVRGTAVGPPEPEGPAAVVATVVAVAGSSEPALAHTAAGTTNKSTNTSGTRRSETTRGHGGGGGDGDARGRLQVRARQKRLEVDHLLSTHSGEQMGTFGARFKAQLLELKELMERDGYNVRFSHPLGILLVCPRSMLFYFCGKLDLIEEDLAHWSSVVDMHGAVGPGLLEELAYAYCVRRNLISFKKIMLIYYHDLLPLQKNLQQLQYFYFYDFEALLSQGTGTGTGTGMGTGTAQVQVQHSARYHAVTVASLAAKMTLQVVHLLRDVGKGIVSIARHPNDRAETVVPDCKPLHRFHTTLLKLEKSFARCFCTSDLEAQADADHRDTACRDFERLVAAISASTTRASASPDLTRPQQSMAHTVLLKSIIARGGYKAAKIQVFLDAFIAVFEHFVARAIRLEAHSTTRTLKCNQTEDANASGSGGVSGGGSSSRTVRAADKDTPGFCGWEYVEKEVAKMRGLQLVRMLTAQLRMIADEQSALIFSAGDNDADGVFLSRPQAAECQAPHQAQHQAGARTVGNDGSKVDGTRQRSTGTGTHTSAESSKEGTGSELHGNSAGGIAVGGGGSGGSGAPLQTIAEQIREITAVVAVHKGPMLDEMQEGATQTARRAACQAQAGNHQKMVHVCVYCSKSYPDVLMAKNICCLMCEKVVRETQHKCPFEGLSITNINPKVATSGFDMCFAPSTFGTGSQPKHVSNPDSVIKKLTPI